VYSSVKLVITAAAGGCQWHKVRHISAASNNDSNAHVLLSNHVGYSLCARTYTYLYLIIHELLFLPISTIEWVNVL